MRVVSGALSHLAAWPALSVVAAVVCATQPRPRAGTSPKTADAGILLSSVDHSRTKMPTPGTLVFFCGKMAAGKSTLARELAQPGDAVLITQDEFLARLFPGDITDVPSFLKYSSRLREALGPHVRALLSKGLTVVLDFPGNTRAQRDWFRELFQGANAAHELHYIDALDDLCKRQLKTRSRHLPAGTAWTTDADFDAITAYFQPPADDEAFTVIVHKRGG